MKTFKSLLFILTVVLTVGSCGNKNNKVEFEQDTTNVADIVQKDHTIYGVCGEGTAMNTLMLITDDGDTMTVSTTEASESGQIHGGLTVGDKLAVILKNGTGNEKVVKSIVNLTTLLGKWVQPNPLDGSDIQGIEIKEGGIASSINLSTKEYQSWKMFNGRLVITSQDNDYGDESETVDTFDIVTLGPDSLRMNKGGDSFEYTRR